MNHVIFFLVMMLSINTFSQNLTCHQLFVSQNDLSIEKSQYSRKMMAQKVIDMGLERNSYAVKWKLKNLKYKGPHETQGEFLVVGISTKQSLQDWAVQVADHTIGLVVNGLPEDNPGSAMLRIGRYIFNYSDLRNNRSMKGIDISSNIYLRRWTEVTYSVTPAEMQAILNFFKARTEGKITAKFDMRNGIKKGDILDPSFDSDSMSLTNESCAAICSSFYNPAWLAHYNDNKLLVELKDRLNLQPYHIAKQTIWANSRRSHLAAITLVGIENRGQPGSDFIIANEWGKLRGMPAHGLIPDMPNGNSITIESTRQSLTDWLDEKNKITDQTNPI